MTSKIQEAQKARRARKRAAKAAQQAPLLQGRYTIECIRCGDPGPGKTFAKRVRVCNSCWRSMTQVEKENVRGFAAHIG